LKYVFHDSSAKILVLEAFCKQKYISVGGLFKDYSKTLKCFKKGIFIKK